MSTSRRKSRKESELDGDAPFSSSPSRRKSRSDSHKGRKDSVSAGRTRKDSVSAGRGRKDSVSQGRGKGSSKDQDQSCSNPSSDIRSESREFDAYLDVQDGTPRQGANDREPSRDLGSLDTHGRFALRPVAESAPRAMLPIFSEKGVWVRPNCIRDSISELQVQNQAAPIEEHAGSVDPDVAVDVARSILAFEFIDCINEDILNHYLPLVDQTMGKDLGLRHNHARLCLPGEHPQAPSSDSGGTPISQEDFDNDSIANYDSNDRCEAGSVSESISQSVASHEQFASQQSWNQAETSGNMTVGEQPLESDLHGDTCVDDNFVNGNEDLDGLTPIDCEEEDNLIDDVADALSISGKLAGSNAKDVLLNASATMTSLNCSTTTGSLHCSTTTGSLHQSTTMSSLHPGSSITAGPSHFYVEESLSCSDGDFDEYHIFSPPEDEFVSFADLGPSRPCTQDTQGSEYQHMDAVVAAQAELWPFANTLAPKAASPARSRKLRAVDSVPTSQNQFREVQMPDVVPGSARSFRHAPSTPLGGGCDVGPLGLPMILPSSSIQLEPASGLQSSIRWTDPASSHAPLASVYAPGAAKVRKSGQHRLERLRLDRRSARTHKRMQKHAQVGSVSARARGRFAAGSAAAEARTSFRTGLLPSLQAQKTCTERQAALGLLVQESGVVYEDDSGSPVEMGATSLPVYAPVEDGEQGGGRSAGDVEPWSARQPSSARESIEDFASVHLKNETARRNKVEEHPGRNSTCPFSHEPMTSSVNLRCGHRFAIDHLDIARRAPLLCAEAGLAAKGPLICALCGDQDVTSTPAGSKMLTTYSTNTDAYLGGIRKDYQLPLHLGGESTWASSLRPRRPL